MVIPVSLETTTPAMLDVREWSYFTESGSRCSSHPQCYSAGDYLQPTTSLFPFPSGEFFHLPSLDAEMREEVSYSIMKRIIVEGGGSLLSAVQPSRQPPL
jgi:hypothetical protein